MQLKNYTFLFLLLLVFSGEKAIAQCPSDTILYFTTQAEVDAFLVDYPGCTEYWGSVDMYNPSGSDIINFQGLQNLTSIGGYFCIRSNYSLTSMSGLENLTSVGGDFSIYGNQALTNISALENLTSIGGGFQIYNIDNLTSMSGLENLTSIGGDFGFSYNDALTSMSGLENLTSIGGFIIYSNDALQSMSGLEGLTSIEGDFYFNGNEALTSMSGLENLSFVGGDFSLNYNFALMSMSGLEGLTSIGGDFYINGNTLLTSMSGLENLSSIEGNFSLYYNLALMSLSGLGNLTSIVGELNIYNNSNLLLCNAPFVCNYLVNGNGTIDIHDNAPGCNNTNEILSQCEDLGKISLHYFYDLNQNATQDNGESYLPMMSAEITPGDYTLFGNQNGAAVKYLHYEDYTVSINEAPPWTLTSGNTSYNISLDSIQNSDTLYFGFTPDSLISNLSTVCVNGLPRCNEFVLFEPMVINNGTTVADGTLWFTVDGNALDFNFIDLPDTTDGSNRYGWHFIDLYPQQIFKKQISIQLPGPPGFPIGDFLNFGTEVNFEDENGLHENELNVHRVEVQCSFDPNDKLVASQAPDNYALIGEDLVYTVRFQNTGNAEAYDVVIKDLLSEKLDLSTFRFIASSHDTVLSTYINDRMLTFEFKDIFLPDSTTNFDESQGYVMYSIRALDTLSDFSTIENTANIFFDYNPAVVTNTTESVMVETFDADEDGFEFWMDCDDNDFYVNSGMVEEPYNGVDDDCDEATLDDDLDQDGFGNAEDCDDNNPLVNVGEEIPYNGLDDDCDETTLDDDLDQDGFGIAEDCDDDNALVNVGEEVPYNGLDDDCDETTLDDDLDQDGFGIAEDCDDNNPLINSDASEIPNNDIDEDCDGQDLIVSAKEVLTIKPQIFPNPTTKILQILFPETVEGTYELRNVSGRLLLQNEINQRTMVNLKDFPTGVYVLLIKTKNDLWVEQIVKL